MKAQIYTKTGDQGQTSLVGGTRVAKTHVRLEAYGTLDELNSCLGMVRSELGSASGMSDVDSRIQDIQNSLFNMGSHFACENEQLRAQLPDLHQERLPALESDMDQWEAQLPPLRTFILPGGSRAAAFTHLARTVCRRAERLCLALNDVLASEGAARLNPQHLIYLNRLSDWLFVLSRLLNVRLNARDIEWSKD